MEEQLEKKRNQTAEIKRYRSLSLSMHVYIYICVCSVVLIVFGCYGYRKTQETMDMLNRFAQTLRETPSSRAPSTKPVPQDQQAEVMDEDQPIKD